MHREAIDYERQGRVMHSLIARLFPICRSITGQGVRDTLSILQEFIALRVHEVPTGTQVFDWQVPKEWSIRDAYIKDASGKRIVDFQQSNLHVISGSVGVNVKLCWDELKQHLHTLPDHPQWIPYRTCFHKAGWGFCISHKQYETMAARGNQQYDVVIDAEHRDGSLTYGELLLPGELQDEVLFSSHVCHPSLANDNLSGIALATFLAKHLAGKRRRFTYRFVFAPATIGAITWLARNEHHLDRVKHGLILSLLGDSGNFTYKKTRRGNTEMDRIIAHILQHAADNYSVVDFQPYGYDERQFCSPGINLPVGCLMRTPNEQYAEYHTSADNLDLVRPEQLAESLSTVLKITDVIEGNRTYINLNPKCEPRLGPRGLYQAFGCGEEQVKLQRSVLWVLNLSDGNHSLLDIAERSGFDFASIRQAATALLDAGLLAERPDEDECCCDTRSYVPDHPTDSVPCNTPSYAT